MGLCNVHASNEREKKKRRRGENKIADAEDSTDSIYVFLNNSIMYVSQRKCVHSSIWLDSLALSHLPT